MAVSARGIVDGGLDILNVKMMQTSSSNV